MKTKLLTVLCCVLALAPAAFAQRTSNEQLQREIDQLKQKLQELEQKLAEQAETKAPPVKVGHADTWKVSGYVQAQYTNSQNAGNGAKNDSQFSIRRGRLKVQANASKRSSFLLQLEAVSGDNKVSVKDASYTYKFDDGVALTIGQRNWNWGFENIQSSSYRLLPERSLTNHKFFPGERDRGIYVEGATKSDHPLYWSLGLWNGNGRHDKDFTKTDPNDLKDVIFRISNLHGYKYHGPAGQFNWQLSAYYGRAYGFQGVATDTATTVTTNAFGNFTKSRLGLAGQYFYEAVPEDNEYQYREGSAIRAELQFGKGWTGSKVTRPAGSSPATAYNWVNASAKGGYLEVSKIIDPRWDVVGRYQLFDPANGPTERALEAGLIYYLDRASKLTLAYNAQNAAAGNDVLTVRFQTKY